MSEPTTEKPLDTYQALKMMKASPDLVKALKAYLRAFDAKPLESVDNTDRVLAHAARSALKKAGVLP